MSHSKLLVLGATGKTGRRICDRLTELDVPFRQGSRGSSPPFDWNIPDTWDPLLNGIDTAYVCYAPDLAVPSAPGHIEAFVERARLHGLRRLVLLSGRGEEEADRCERIVQDSGLEWTIVRASWFSQNFSEGPFLPMLLDGTLALPAGEILEPFVDADDIADVAVAALTDDRHAGQVYELTGPRLLTFTEAVEEIAAVSGRSLRYVEVPLQEFSEGMLQAGVPADLVDLFAYLFTTVLDGRNSSLGDGVRRSLGREARDFGEFASHAASSWRISA